jgi:GH25 family lysozyme M1 (1,4-beta-N-acetylmuramidase)
MEVVHGIDVSEFQNEIDWKKVKSSEADFVFVRAGYRRGETGELAEDADFREFMKGAEKSGIMVGAYFFSQALNEEEAVEEADYLLELVEPYDIDMPLVIDYELFEGGRLQQAVKAGEMPNASDYHNVVIAFCNRIEEAGYESAVYANYDMLTNYMDSTILDKEEVIWAAQYGGSCHVKGNYRYWQCAEDAKISGIKGTVDHDIWYIEPGRVYPTKARGSKSQTSIGDVKVEFDEGETVFDVLVRICERLGIQIEYSWTPMYNSYYVESINHLYEMDCGPESGWMYKVNGWFPNYGCSSYTVENGDNIVWCYTCKGLGADVGGGF